MPRAASLAAGAALSLACAFLVGAWALGMLGGAAMSSSVVLALLAFWAVSLPAVVAECLLRWRGWLWRSAAIFAGTFASFLAARLAGVLAPFGDLFASGVMIEGTILYCRIAAADASPVRPAVAFAVVASGLLAGCGVARHVWSESVPVVLLRAADRLARRDAACIETHRGPVTRRSDLRGRQLLAGDGNGNAWAFHAVLKVERGDGSHLWNWSHRLRGFDPVGAHARAGLHLDKTIRCKPQREHVRRLMTARA